MNAIFTAAKEVCDFMADRQWRFCIIGGLAVLRWGELRTTRDADLTLFTGFGDESTYLDALLARFEGRISDSHAFALRQRVLLINAGNGIPVDVALAAFPFEEDIIRRATPFEFADGITLPTCSAEDLFVMKIFAARVRDLQDAEGIAIRQRLDKRAVLQRLKPLCDLKETPELFEMARQIIEKQPWPE